MNFSINLYLSTLPYIMNIDYNFHNYSQPEAFFAYDELMYSYRFAKVVHFPHRLYTQATLPNFSLTFEGNSKMWMGAVANIRFSGMDYVAGTIWAATKSDFKKLNKYYSPIYVPRVIPIVAKGFNQLVNCQVYTLKNYKDGSIYPSATYMAFMRIGARESKVPSLYYNRLENVMSNNITVSLSENGCDNQNNFRFMLVIEMIVLLLTIIV